jgi:hypothetical protein
MNGKDVDVRHDNGETFRWRTAKSFESVEAQSIGGRIRTGENVHRRIKRSETKSGRAVPTSTGLARGMKLNNGQMGQRCGHIRFGSESRNAGSTRIRNPDIGPETRSLKVGMRYRRSEVGRRRCDLDQPSDLGPILDLSLGLKTLGLSLPFETLPPRSGRGCTQLLSIPLPEPSHHPIVLTFSTVTPNQPLVAHVITSHQSDRRCRIRNL